MLLTSWATMATATATTTGGREHGRGEDEQSRTGEKGDFDSSSKIRNRL